MFLHVEGMSCNHCKMAVEKAVLNVEGVTEVSVDLASKRVEIQGEADRRLVKTAIEAAGYQVVD